MKSLCLEKYGSLDFFKLTEITIANPVGNQVRVQVHASALNPADYKVALGEVKFLHGRRFPLALGYDFSGVINAVSSGVRNFKIGDEVFGFLPYGPANNQGAFGEAVLADANQIALKPKNVTHAQAAVSATSGLTAIQSLRDLGKLKPGARVLITGVSGGVGSAAIQVAKKLGASEVVAVGSGQGLELARKLGAQKQIDRNKENIYAAASGTFDIIFDAAAVYRWSDWKSKLKPGGVFVSTLPSLNFVVDKIKSLMSDSSVSFITVKSKGADLKLLAAWLEAGIQLPIDSTVPLSEVPKGLERLKRGEVLGKIAVNVLND